MIGDDYRWKAFKRANFLFLFIFFFFSPPVAQILFRNKLELEVNPVFGVSTLRL